MMQDKFDRKVIDELIKQAGQQRLDAAQLRRLVNQNLEYLQEHEQEWLVSHLEILTKLGAGIVADNAEKSKSGKRIEVQRKSYEILRRYFPNENLSVFTIKGKSNE